MRHLITFALALAACSLVGATLDCPLIDDYAIAEGDSGPEVAGDTTTTIRLGSNTGKGGGRNVLFIFSLPALPEGATISGANLGFRVTELFGGTFSGDLWSLGTSTNTTRRLDYFEADTGDPGNIKLQDDLLTPTTPANTWISTEVFAHIEDFYASNPDYTGGQYLFLRLNPDADGGLGNSGWDIASLENEILSSASLTLTTEGGPPPSDGPNFIFMITDDQRWDAVGVVLREQETNGEQMRFPFFKNATPNMDRIAAEGLRFRNAFVHTSLCSPSRAAFLTGTYNHLNGIIDNQNHFPVESVTYATLMRDVGYETAYVGKWHMKDQAQRPGFDWIATYTGQGKYFNQTFLKNGGTVGTSGWIDDRSTDFALEFLGGRDVTKPFVMVLGFKTPHDPFTPATRNDSLYGIGPIVAPANASALPPYPLIEPVLSNSAMIDYFEGVHGVDENVGRVLDYLDANGLADNTVVVFTSDNGYFLGDHNMDDKRAAYEESMRIPLLIRYPPLIDTPRVSDEFVTNIDLAPTFLDIAGIPIPAHMQGRSWQPLMAGESVAWRDAIFYEYFRESEWPEKPTQLAVRTAGMKLIEYPGNPSWNQFFDLTSDPWEMNNLHADPAHASALKIMEGRLRNQMINTGLFPRLDSVVQNGGNASLEFTSGIGPRWEMSNSTGLGEWNPFMTIKVLSSKLSVTDPLNLDGRNFYRFEMLAD